ncbi:MAG: branched-chain amino acid ABC transporter ATP-binding protein/permease, partial [Gammaproteobacteria bacterium]|nr:branched-chain amino acid ABC transporter ATP-binding protein/permease [Gammaproteobacteria bacterium]
MRRSTALWSVAVLAAVIAAIFGANGYQVYVLAMVALTAIVGVGLNVLLGLTGQISLGHVGFYAIGAYVMGILSVRLEWSFWTGLVLAGLAAGVAGAGLAVPALRVRGPYLAMVTIAFGFVVEQGAAEWRALTGGWNGLMGIPAPALLGYQLDERGIAYLALALCVVAVYLYSRLRDSPWGQAMRAIRDSEVAGQSIGLNPVVIRTVAFTLSAVLAGIAGAVFASLSTFISPESFPFFQSILFLLVVMIGGADRVLGPVLGAIVVVLLPELLSFLAGYRLLFVGALLLVVLWLAPDGIAGMAMRVLGRVDEGAPPVRRRDVADILAAGRGSQGLAASALSISFGGVQAVGDFSFEASPGQVTSIIGPNGAGKTTVLNLVCGFYKPDRGTVCLGDTDVAGRSSHVVARAGIARTYQSTQLFDQMSVLENVVIALRKGRLPARALFGSGGDREAEEIAESLLAFVGYEAPIRRMAGALPHVDKRLVEIARALAMRPSVLLLDEPAAGLGDADTARLGRLLRDIAERGIAVILVEHDMSLVMEVSDRVLVLDAGTMIAEGVPSAVRTDPAVLKAYLGEGEARGRGR